MCESAGEVADLHWVTRGSAVVIFKEAEAAKKAIELLHKRTSAAMRHSMAHPWNITSFCTSIHGVYW